MKVTRLVQYRYRRIRQCFGRHREIKSARHSRALACNVDYSLLQRMELRAAELEARGVRVRAVRGDGGGDDAA